MTENIINTLKKPRLSVKAQTFATLVAIVSAVVLPELFHVVGAVSGSGSALGETFLPMQLPIILVGLLAGPYAGLIAGLLSPLISFGVTAMPAAVMLPFMMLELAAYGFVSGILSECRMPVIAKVLIAQIAGRVIRAAAILFGVYALNSKMNVSVIWTSIAVGLPGLILQWAFIPLIINRLENYKNER